VLNQKKGHLQTDFGTLNVGGSSQLAAAVATGSSSQLAAATVSNSNRQLAASNNISQLAAAATPASSC